MLRTAHFLCIQPLQPAQRRRFLTAASRRPRGRKVGRHNLDKTDFDKTDLDKANPGRLSRARPSRGRHSSLGRSALHHNRNKLARKPVVPEPIQPRLGKDARRPPPDLIRATRPQQPEISSAATRCHARQPRNVSNLWPVVPRVAPVLLPLKINRLPAQASCRLIGTRYNENRAMRRRLNRTVANNWCARHLNQSRNVPSDLHPVERHRRISSPLMPRRKLSTGVTPTLCRCCPGWFIPV